MKSGIRIQPDGREKCTGYQWTKRVRELKARAEGFCEAGQDLEGADALIPGHLHHFIGDDGDPHHIVKRSKSRDDRLSNLLWVCHWAHIQLHGRYF
jgi:hypothetical protein